MITKLTPEQEAILPRIRDEWLRKGLSTTPIDRKKAIADFTQFQTEILKRPPAPVVILDGPIHACLVIGLFNQVEQQVERQMERQAEQQVRRKVERKVERQVERQVRRQVGRQVRQQVGQQVDQQVERQVERQVDQQVEQQVAKFIWPYWDGQFRASFFAFYDVLKELGLSYPKEYDILRKCAVGICWPLENICILADAPIAIHMRNGLLHKDEAPAIEYRDGLKVFALNGITMKPEYVLTPAEKLDPAIILAEPNVDMRRELIGKIGVERFMQVTPHKILEKRNNYELLSIDLSDTVRNCRYLKMVNPSVGCYHIEGVDRTCETVQQALNWRASQDKDKLWNPATLT